MLNGKLVRDNIPTIITANGGQPVTRVLTPQEFGQEIALKVIEEANELLRAGNLDERLTKAADLLEALGAYLEFHEIALRDVCAKKRKRRAKRGGFEERIFLERVERA